MGFRFRVRVRVRSRVRVRVRVSARVGASFLVGLPSMLRGLGGSIKT